MKSPRTPSNDERRLLKALIERADSNDLSLQDDLLVESMNDDGMGSLKLVPLNASPYRKYGRKASNLEFNDVDGVKVSVVLNLDQNGHLFEIDIWKTDFSPLIRIPKHLV